LYVINKNSGFRIFAGYFICGVAPLTQAFLLVGTLLLLPVILTYSAWSYWVFRGKERGRELSLRFTLITLKRRGDSKPTRAVIRHEEGRIALTLHPPYSKR
jgi:hypothetical protein